MEQKIISKTEEQCIYLIEDTNLNFYLTIPNNKNLSIVLGLFSNITDEIIKSLPKQTDKALVVPVINNEILTRANQFEPTSFKYLDSVLSYLINISYKLLTHNKIEVNSKILLNNHSSYENFNNKFIEKYQGRVELHNLIQKQEPTPVVSPTINNIEETVAPIVTEEPVTSPNPTPQASHEPGFVSYVLLGVLVAVISLVFLYLIL